MKRLLYLIVAVLVASLMITISPGFAETPKVPITYETDTSETIARRAQWIEGAKKEGVLNWWGSGNPNVINKIKAEFNKIYPFIEINYWRGRDMSRVTKIEAEHTINKLTVDIMEGGAPENFPRWRKMGIPAKYIDIIPGIESWDKKMYSKYDDWVMPEHNVLTPQYNTNLVSKDEAPKSWEDILDPKWQGHVGITTDMKVWVILAIGEGGWGIEKTEAFCTELQKQKLIWGRGHSATFALMTAGEFKLHAENYLQYYIRYTLRSKDPAPAAIVKAKTAAVAGSYFLAAEKGPHPNATRLFLEWFFSPAGLKVNERETAKGNTAPGSGTIASKILEGTNLVFKTEEVLIKGTELGLFDRFAKILKVTK